MHGRRPMYSAPRVSLKGGAGAAAACVVAHMMTTIVARICIVRLTDRAFSGAAGSACRSRDHFTSAERGAEAPGRSRAASAATPSWAAARNANAVTIVSLVVQNYVSAELTHFVGRSQPTDDDRYSLLVKIVRGGVLLDPHYRDRKNSPITYFDVKSKDGSTVRQNYFPEPYFEVRQNGPIEQNEFVRPEMVCFCDIPVDQLRIHTSKYSRFGLALPKTFAIAQGANPVYYIAKGAASPLRLIAQEGRYADFYDGRDRGVISERQDRVSLLEKLKARTFELIGRYSDLLQKKLLEYKRGKDDPQERRAELLSVVEFMVGTFCYVHGMTKVFDPQLPFDDPNN